MVDTPYHRITKMASEPDAMAKTAEYLASCMGMFLKKRDKVLICFPDEGASLGTLLKAAVLRCEAVPMFLGEDDRWLTILKTAFVNRVDAIVGAPLMLLGLSKVAKHMGTPLFARNVLVAGYPSTDWMIEGIQRGLDCRVWGCFDPGFSAMIAGFSCDYSSGIHLRSDSYRALIIDEENRLLPEGQVGRVILSPLGTEDLYFDTGDQARLELAPCRCGCLSPRLMDMDTHLGVDPGLSKMGESFHYWGSVLDCRLANTGCGLEVEMVVFPGEKLPKIPECAKLIVRAWNPEKDRPLPHAYVLKNRIFSRLPH